VNREEDVQKNNEERKRDVGKALLRGMCLPVRTESGQVLLYEILDQAAKEVRLLGANKAPLEQAVSIGYDMLADDMKLFTTGSETIDVPTASGSKQVKTTAIKPVKTLTIRQVKDVVERYITEQHEQHDIAPFAWKEDSRFTLKRLTFDITEGPTPAWDQFCIRLTDAPAFKAWVWSIFEPKHVGRQGLWIKGGEGQDGKSSVLRVIRGIVGNNASAVLDGSERDNRFVHSNLFDKRLLIYPDCKQPTFVKGQIYRNYTGGDDVSVEFKGMQPFSKSVYARVVVGANYSPTIDDEGADKSRLLVVSVSPTTEEQRRDVGWIRRLEEEVPLFLYQCRAEYQRLCQSHYLIETTSEEAREQLLSEATSTSEGRMESIFEKWFIKNPEGQTRRCDVFQVLREERMSPADMGQFKRYLERQGILEKQLRVESQRVKVYEGVVRRDAEERVEMAATIAFLKTSQKKDRSGKGNA
jgi:hypothetical protein